MDLFIYLFSILFERQAVVLFRRDMLFVLEL
jgi:hypothetical protein